MGSDSIKYRYHRPESRQSIPGVFGPHPLFLANILSKYVRSRSCWRMRCALCVQYSVTTLRLWNGSRTKKCPPVKDIWQLNQQN